MPSKSKTILKPEDELKLVKKILKRDYLINLADLVARARSQAVGVEARSSMQIAKTNTAFTTVAFPGALFDSSGFLPGGGGAAITVPANQAGRYDLVVSVRWCCPVADRGWSPAEAHAGYFYTKVHLNGSTTATRPLRNTTNATVDATGTNQNMSWHLNLEAGDSLEFLIQQSVHQDLVKADVAVCLTRLGGVP